ncbi:MAG TPA: hypothetical protein VF647_02205 [Longimicrobium sp.]
MSVSVGELLAWAGGHENEEWTTLCEKKPFSYRVTGSGIEYTPQTGIPRNVPKKEMESFCAEFNEIRSFSPGQYPNRRHKSYSLPLIKRFLSERG